MSVTESRAAGHAMSEAEKDRIVAMVDAVIHEVTRTHRPAPAGPEPTDVWLSPADAELIRRPK